jgi:hypothetical protein
MADIPRPIPDAVLAQLSTGDKRKQTGRFRLDLSGFVWASRLTPVFRTYFSTIPDSGARNE